ncbi:tandem-95 repeat protein, partial [Puteibacter caeruleilacunae]
GSCNTASVSVTVNAVNDAPVAVDDIATTTEDNPISNNVLSNDSDTESDVLSIVTFVVDGDGSTYNAGETATILNVGTIIINSGGSFTFTPATDYHGPVPPVTYTVSDGNGGEDHGELNITVTPINDTPIAHGDSKTTAEDSSAGGDLSVNDIKSGDGGNVWNVKEEPLHGTVVLELDGSYIYTPDADYVGPDSFTYKLCDTDGSCDEGTVNVTVTSVNDDPIAVDDVATTPE